MNKEELHNLIEKQQPNICQIAAIKDNEVVYSDTWNDYKKDDCTHIMSATKSIMALLIGIAIDKGQIRSVDDKVLDYFPDYKVKRGEKTIHEVTIKHLLTMRAPYKCKGDPWTKVCSSDNWTYASLDLLGGRKGLTDEFNYLSFMGLPCPNLGTGGYAFHGPYEHITVEGMDKAVEILLNIAEAKR